MLLARCGLWLLLLPGLPSLGCPRLSICCSSVVIASSMLSTVAITPRLSMAGMKPVPMACRLVHCCAAQPKWPTMRRHLGGEQLARPGPLGWAARLSAAGHRCVAAHLPYMLLSKLSPRSMSVAVASAKQNNMRSAGTLVDICALDCVAKGCAPAGGRRAVVSLCSIPLLATQLTSA